LTVTLLTDPTIDKLIVELSVDKIYQLIDC